MSDAIIGALRVIIGADTAALDKGLKDSQAGLSAFGTAVTAGMAAVAAGVAAAAYQIAGSIKSTIEAAASLNRMSQSTGMSTEALSKLGYAAELSDVGMEALGKSVGKLSKSIISAANDAASPAAQAFSAMGIQLKNASDGSIKPADQVLSEIAGKFVTYRDGVAKTALAIQLFGKAGAAMIPLLNQGASGLNEAADEASRYGLVLDNQTTAAAEEFSKSLLKMDKIKQGVITTLTAKMLPAFEALAATMLKAREESTLYSAIGDKIAQMMNGLVTVGIGLITTWQQIFATAANLKTAFSQLAHGDFSGAWETMKKSAADTVTAMTGLAGTIQKMWAPTETDKAMSEMSSAVDKFMGHMVTVNELLKREAPYKTISEEAAKALQSFLDTSAKRSAAMNADADAAGKSVGEQAKLRLEYEAGAIALTRSIPLTEEWKNKIAAAGDAAAAAAMKLQGANITQEMLAPWDLRNQKLQQYSAALVAARASSNLLAAATLKIQFPAFYAAAQAAADFGAQIDQIATNSISGLSSALTNVITGAKSAGEAFAAFGKQVLSWLVEMIVKAILFKAISVAIGFFGGGPVSMAQSTSSTGLSLTNTGGLHADGGLITGPGTSTSDSIPAMLSNGEFVINADAVKSIGIPRLHAMNNGDTPSLSAPSVPQVAAPSGPQTLEIRLPQRARFSYDEAIDMMGQMARAMGNGYKLKFT